MSVGTCGVKGSYYFKYYNNLVSSNMSPGTYSPWLMLSAVELLLISVLWAVYVSTHHEKLWTSKPLPKPQVTVLRVLQMLRKTSWQIKPQQIAYCCQWECIPQEVLHCPSNWLKGTFLPKMKASYLIVFGTPSRMVKVRAASGKPFWTYKRLNNCVALCRESDDILVVEKVVFYVTASTKTSSLSRHGGGETIQSPIYPKWLIACTSDLHHSTQHPKLHETRNFHFLGSFPFN